MAISGRILVAETYGATIGSLTLSDIIIGIIYSNKARDTLET